MAHAFGLVRQVPDSRDWKLTVPARVTVALPPAFDLSAQLFAKVPQLDQGRLGSCGPNTAAECIDYDELNENMALTGPSRLFTYYNSRLLMGTVGQDSGVDNRTMLKGLAQYGFCPETIWPYSDDPITFFKQPPASCYQAAAANKITNYAGVQVAADQIKGVLYSQRMPIIFGFDVFQGIEGQQAAATGIVPDPKTGETPIGGHDVSIVGWDDATQRFKFRNHWMNGPGIPWGDHGYGYLSYNYALSSHASDLWAINAVPGGLPNPVPVPPAPTPGNLPVGLGFISWLAAKEGYSVNIPAKGGERLGIV